MKTVLITVSEGSVARNILRSFVLEKLLARPEIEIILLVPAEKVELYRNEFGTNRVLVVGHTPSGQTFFTRALSYLSRNGVLTRTILTDQRSRLSKQSDYLSFIIKRAVTYFFGWSRIFHFFVRILASFRKPSVHTLKLFEKVSPVLVFATDVQDDLDLDALAAAKRLGIKTIGMVRSWDNLTSGGLIMAVPDTLLVWDPYLFKKATKVQHIPAKKMVITGIPHYDWYAKREIILPREKFLADFQIDPRKKIILFAGIGNFLNPHETEVAQIISEAVKRGEILDEVAVIFRPHPNFMIEGDRIKSLSNMVFDEGVAYYTGKDKTSWEMDKDKIGRLVNSLYHSDLVITTASTIALDAVSFDKPVICVGFDGESDEPYWNSVKRFYFSYTHYRDISKTHGFRIVFSKDELVRAINAYLKNPSEDKEGREKIRNEFIWRLDGKSAERVVENLLMKI